MDRHRRRCSRCGAEKPLTGFYRDAKGRDGHQAACKDCHKERVRAYRERLRATNAGRSPSRAPKRCSRCAQIKPSDAFHRNRSTPDGLHWVCATCTRDPKLRRPIERRRTIRNYGITREDFESLDLEQGSRCAICQRTFDETPHIDHDHASGRVRGLLCRSCNLGLGYFSDDVARLTAAIAYLEDRARSRGAETG